MFDALELKWRNTDQAHFINHLYQGKMKDYVKCLKVLLYIWYNKAVRNNTLKVDGCLTYHYRYMYSKMKFDNSNSRLADCWFCKSYFPFQQVSDYSRNGEIRGFIFIIFYAATDLLQTFIFYLLHKCPSADFFSLFIYYGFGKKYQNSRVFTLWLY